MRSRAAAVALLLMVPAAHAHDFWPPAVERGRYLMGTLCTIAVEDADTTRASATIEGAFAVIDQLESVMSSWRPDSELSRLNAAGPGGATCSAELWAVLDSSLALAAETAGAFDPTIDPVNVAWDARGEGRVPTAAERAAARQRVGWQRVSRDPARRRVGLERGAAFDLGGIGKGFALDRAADTLRAAGIERALLNFGGEVLAIGVWDVEVADPRDRLRPAMRVAVRDQAVSTSAQGERSRVIGGKTYGHIFDPRSGAPVAFAGSVTVVAASGTRADALSTALLVMGRDPARRWAERHPEVGVLWIEPSGSKLRAWRWNLPAVESAGEAPVAWME